MAMGLGNGNSKKDGFLFFLVPVPSACVAWWYIVATLAHATHYVLWEVRLLTLATVDRGTYLP